MEMPASEITVAAASSALRGRNAARMPSGSASTSATTIAAAASAIVERQRLGDERGDGAALIGTGVAERAVGDVLEEAAELDDQRLIEIHARAHLDLVDGIGALAEQVVDRVAGDEVHEQEHQHRDAEHGDEARQEAAAQEASAHPPRIRTGWAWERRTSRACRSRC